MSAGSVEVVLDPELPICDAHHHLWDRPDSRYLADEFVADLRSGHRIVSSIYVDCESMYRAGAPHALRSLGETEFADSVAARFAASPGEPRICAGIIGFADLNLGPAVAEVLDGHMALTPRFKGVRHCAAWDRSEEIRNAPTRPFEQMLGDSTFRRGFAELSRRNLAFDAWVYHPQIPEVTSLARSFPETLIVLDHLGGPLGIGPYAGQRQAVLQEWRKSMMDLSKCPNVMVKLGGMLMPLSGWGFHRLPQRPDSQHVAAVLRDYCRYAIDLFGVARCMFESNYPADRSGASYRTLWNAFKRLVADFSPAERAALFHDNAVRIYRLA